MPIAYQQNNTDQETASESRNSTDRLNKICNDKDGQLKKMKQEMNFANKQHQLQQDEYQRQLEQLIIKLNEKTGENIQLVKNHEALKKQMQN